jgi:hypothetical protein
VSSILITRSNSFSKAYFCPWAKVGFFVLNKTGQNRTRQINLFVLVKKQKCQGGRYGRKLNGDKRVNRKNL